MVDLGSLGGESSAVAVNEVGEVAGWSTTAAGVSHAFVWSTATGMVDLGALGIDSAAVDLDNTGMVVGNWTTATGATRAFAWTQKDGMVDLGTLGGRDARATAVNNRGEIVGSSGHPASSAHSCGGWSGVCCLTEHATLPPMTCPLSLTFEGPPRAEIDHAVHRWAAAVNDSGQLHLELRAVGREREEELVADVMTCSRAGAIRPVASSSGSGFARWASVPHSWRCCP